jgi:hypothetical protein
VGLRAGLDTRLWEKSFPLPEIQPRSPVRPVWSHALYTELPHIISKDVPLQPCRRQGEMYSFYLFLTLIVDGVSGQCHAAAALYSGNHWIAGWVDLRGGLDTEGRGKIVCPCRGSNPGRRVC